MLQLAQQIKQIQQAQNNSPTKLPNPQIKKASPRTLPITKAPIPSEVEK